MLTVSVSDRMVSLRMRWTDDKAERQVVLPTMYSREKEEAIKWTERRSELK